MGDRAGQRMGDDHLVGSPATGAEREVATDVDDEAQPGQARGHHVGGQALAEAAAVEHGARRATDRAGVSVDAELLPARGGMRRGGRSGRSGRQRRRQRGRLTGPVPVVSRLGDLSAQGHVHQPAGAAARPRAGADQGAHVLVGGHITAWIVGERVEVGGRVEARPAALEFGQQCSCVGSGVLQARRRLWSRHAVGKHEAPMRAHHREGDVEQAHDALVLAPGVEETAPEESPESGEDDPSLDDESYGSLDVVGVAFFATLASAGSSPS